MGSITTSTDIAISINDQAECEPEARKKQREKNGLALKKIEIPSGSVITRIPGGVSIQAPGKEIESITTLFLAEMVWSRAMQ